MIVSDREFSLSKEVLIREKRNSFAWLAVASAQTKLEEYWKKKKKFSGRERNSVVKAQNLHFRQCGGLYSPNNLVCEEGKNITE